GRLELALALAGLHACRFVGLGGPVCQPRDLQHRQAPAGPLPVVLHIQLAKARVNGNGKPTGIGSDVVVPFEVEAVSRRIVVRDEKIEAGNETISAGDRVDGFDDLGLIQFFTREARYAPALLDETNDRPSMEEPG